MTCPLCAARKGRRTCPALGREICSVCCGTKRRVEIRCPPDCPYLAASAAHPPAVALRQRERDARFIVPLVHELPEAAYGLFLAVQETVRRHRATAIPALLDADVAEAAGTLAATLETASRGIIYEHRTTSLPAQRLMAELRQLLDEAARAGSRPPHLERDAAIALRRVERAAREARRYLEPTETAYLDLLSRLPYPRAGGASAGTPGGGPEPVGAAPLGARGSGLILPG